MMTNNIKKEIEDDSEQSKFMDSLNMIYDKAVSWITGSDIPPAQKMWDKYLEKYDNNKYLASIALIRIQYYKTFWTGFVSWMWWLMFLPITLPADLTSSLFIEMRMIWAIAYIWWYDLSSRKAKSLVFMCLLWWGVKKILKNSWIKLWQKTIKNALAKIPEKAFIAINKKLWVQLFAKLSGKWVVSISKAVPVLWGFIGWWINIYYTKWVWKKALNLFIIDDMTDEEKEKYIPKEKEWFFSKIKTSWINLYDEKIKNIGNKKIEEDYSNHNCYTEEEDYEEEEDYYKEKEEYLSRQKEWFFSKIKTSWMNLYDQKIKNREHKKSEEDDEEEYLEEEKNFEEEKKQI